MYNEDIRQVTVNDQDLITNLMLNEKVHELKVRSPNKDYLIMKVVSRYNSRSFDDEVSIFEITDTSISVLESCVLVDHVCDHIKRLDAVLT